MIVQGLRCHCRATPARLPACSGCRSHSAACTGASSCGQSFQIKIQLTCWATWDAPHDRMANSHRWLWELLPLSMSGCKTSTMLPAQPSLSPSWARHALCIKVQRESLLFGTAPGATGPALLPVPDPLAEQLQVTEGLPSGATYVHLTTFKHRMLACQ